MQISLRSQLIAGTTAIVGASAIAMTPVTGAHLSLPSVQVPSSAQVAMAAFSSPLAQLSLTTLLHSTYLFNGDAQPAGRVELGLFRVRGSGTGEQGGLPVLPAGLALPEAGGYSSVGLIPQIIDDALPIISQLGYNGSEYLNATATSVALAGVQLGEGITGAIEDLLSFDIPGALESRRHGDLPGGQHPAQRRRLRADRRGQPARGRARDHGGVGAASARGHPESARGRRRLGRRGGHQLRRRLQ